MAHSSDLFEQFRTELDKERKHMAGPEGRGGDNVLGGPGGPAGSGVVECLFRIVQAQQKQLDELRVRLDEVSPSD